MTPSTTPKLPRLHIRNDSPFHFDDDLIEALRDAGVLGSLEFPPPEVTWARMKPVGPQGAQRLVACIVGLVHVGHSLLERDECSVREILEEVERHIGERGVIEELRAHHASRHTPEDLCVLSVDIETATVRLCLHWAEIGVIIQIESEEDTFG